MTQDLRSPTITKRSPYRRASGRAKGLKVLFATDGSPSSQSVERLLARAAGELSHEVNVLYVVPAVGKDPAALLLQKAGGAMVNKVVSDMKLATSFRLTPEVRRSNHLADTILAAAADHEADIMALGARGLSPLQSLLLGSVSARVIRRADRAVLVARAAQSPLTAPLKVLAAVDGSAASRRAVTFLNALVSRADCRLTLIHVTPNLHPVTWPDLSPAALSRPYPESNPRAAKARGERFLGHWVKKLEARWGTVQPLPKIGIAADQILNAAEKGKFDLIVMGRRGLNAAQRLWLGSVSQSVLANAPCSVLVTP